MNEKKSAPMYMNSQSMFEDYNFHTLWRLFLTLKKRAVIYKE